MGGAYKKATDTKAAHARQCVDPFHVIKLANEAIDKTRRGGLEPGPAPPTGQARRDGPARTHRAARDQSRWVKHTRWALLKDPDQLKPSQLEVLHELRRSRLGALPLLAAQGRAARPVPAGRPDRRPSPPATGGWRGPAAAASPPSSPWPRPSGPTATASWPPSSWACPTPSSKALNSKIRLINHRGYGHHSAAALIAMIYLCCGGITVELPFN